MRSRKLEPIRSPIAALCGLAVTLTAAVATAGPLTPREIYQRTAKAVVLVFATDGSAQGSAGTGSVLTAEGDIITNAHVVSKGGRPYRRLFVYMKPDQLTGNTQKDLKHRHRVTLVDIDPELDLALLRMVEPPADLTTLDFVDPRAVEVGDPVVAIGHPETGGLWTLTTGTVSSLVSNFQGREGKDVFQTDASVNRGNSGGPLLNAYGQMVGINTSISRRASDGLAITDINFSLKSSVAVEWLRRRSVLELAYVLPEDPRDRAIAMADTPSTEVAPGTVRSAGGARPALKAEEVVDAKPETITVVEPSSGVEVAEDPEFSAVAAETYGQTTVASRGAKIEGEAKTKASPKQLTRSRPYAYDEFVAKRVAEIRALEGIMKDMRTRSQGRKARPNRGFDAMGLE